MKFDISKLDSARVLQALFKFAFVRGMGVVGDKANEKRPELSYSEAQNLIDQNTEINDGRGRVTIDFVHGRPIKLSFDMDKGIVDSYPYDIRHGRYRFLYALLCEIGSDSVVFVRKGYPKDFEKPKESDPEQMKMEYHTYSLKIHWLEMKKNYKLN